MTPALRLARLGLAAALLAACSGGDAPPQSARMATPRWAPDVTAHLFLGPEAPITPLFAVPGTVAQPAELTLVEVAGRPARLAAVCDGPARFRARPDPPDPAVPRPDPAWAPAGATLMADLGAGSRGALRLDLAPGTGDCRLSVRRGPQAPAVLRLTRGAAPDPLRARLDRGAPRCAPRPGGDALERAFAAPRALAMSCPMPPGAWQLYPDGIAALDRRIAALTGRPVGRAALLSGDPDLPLDFSAAPQLDLIVLSYLNLNADVTGALMVRMLEHHAARGTEVRILVAEPMWARADRALYEGLAARYPHVRIEPWRYAPRPGDGFEAQAGRVHRVQHTKLFAVLARDPGRSVAMIGGRNLADGYAFDQPHDLSAHPDLRQYVRGQTLLGDGFHSYSDLEIAFTGAEQVRAAVALWAELWNRAPGTDRPRAPDPPAGQPPAQGPVLRHFVSVPWADGQAQIALFADLIDAAQHRIDIASPYLNPPGAIAAALDRALARGVRVRIVTTERVNEPGDIFITGLNRMFGWAWAGRLTYLDHDPQPSLLHTKAMVIDGRLTVIGSTNLNLRSFGHDWENGLVILDTGLAAAVTAVIGRYAADSRPIDPQARIAPLARLLLAWPPFRRSF